jgi:DNA-binding response OmpR family regulator
VAPVFLILGQLGTIYRYNFWITAYPDDYILQYLTMSNLICILEDDPGIRDVLELLFLEEGYRVEAYSTINEFFARKPSVPGLFILDVMLPDGNGLEVCRVLKADAATSTIPIMVMSAHAGIQHMSVGCQAEEFVVKPFDINVLLRKVERQLNQI